ncbi:OmpA family protein [Patiriisocius sp. Uisw_017]|jgi:outer membrane protein OmpA-like peptidoglycan-associated protein|uniref:OmpA family protein n=1 Tax=Patiriisocius sp. Uisw_017 TaxID=3230968 RepID=UPI0039EC4F6B
MKKIFKQIATIALSVTLITVFTNCEATKNVNNKQKGAVIGATSGALLGAILGNNIGKGGNGALGAIIGGVVGGGAGVLIGNKMDKQAQQIENEIPGAQVERIDDNIVITFDENSGVYFDTAKFYINPASQTTLDKLSGVLVEYGDTNILIIGHTDSVGNDANNMKLSKNRAMSVNNYFNNKGISSNRLTTNWYGEQSPVGDNATAEGRKKNRRVNIVIVPNEKMEQDAVNESNGN